MIEFCFEDEIPLVMELILYLENKANGLCAFVTDPQCNFIFFLKGPPLMYGKKIDLRNEKKLWMSVRTFIQLYFL